jgi:hypothetical protein
MPDYIFTGRTLPDYVLVGGRNSPSEVLVFFEHIYGAGKYQIKEVLIDDWRDMSRPEIPWHSFGPPSESGLNEPARGFVVLERIR